MTTGNLLHMRSLLRLARDTISNPREGATTVLSFAPPRQALWLMFALIVVVSLFMGEIVALIAQANGAMPAGAPMTTSPIVLGLLQAAFMFVIVHAITHVGRLFGGTGVFEEALLLVWLQFIVLCVQVVQIVFMLLVPPVAPLITVLALGLFLWLLVNFIAVLHGFTSLGMVFVMTIVSSLALLFVLSVALSLLGLTSSVTG